MKSARWNKETNRRELIARDAEEDGSKLVGQFLADYSAKIISLQAETTVRSMNGLR